MLKLRHRKRLRRKEALGFIQSLKNDLGIEIANADEPIESADADGWKLLIIKGKILAIIVNDRPFLSVRGLLTCKPKKQFVTVDMGAVKFVCNGADVMAPGIVDADQTISEGDLVWIRDERNKQPLAIGQALISGAEMIESRSGKAIKTLHFVGDKIWKLDEE